MREPKKQTGGDEIWKSARRVSTWRDGSCPGMAVLALVSFGQARRRRTRPLRSALSATKPIVDARLRTEDVDQARPRQRRECDHLARAPGLRDRQGLEHLVVSRRRGRGAARERLPARSVGPQDGHLSRGPGSRELRGQPLPAGEHQPSGHDPDAGPPAHPARRPALRRQRRLAPERTDLRCVAHREQERQEPGARRHLPQSRESHLRPRFAAGHLQGRQRAAQRQLPDQDRQDRRLRLSTAVRRHRGRAGRGARFHLHLRPAVRRREAGRQDQDRLPRFLGHADRRRRQPAELRPRLPGRRAQRAPTTSSAWARASRSSKAMAPRASPRRSRRCTSSRAGRTSSWPRPRTASRTPT